MFTKNYVLAFPKPLFFCKKNGEYENYSVHFIAKNFFIVLMCTLDSFCLAILLVSNPSIVRDRMKITVIMNLQLQLLLLLPN